MSEDFTFWFSTIYLAIGSLDSAGSARALSPSSPLPLSTTTSVTPVPASLVPEPVDEREKEEEEEASGSEHILAPAFRGNSVNKRTVQGGAKIGELQQAVLRLGLREERGLGRECLSEGERLK